MTIKVGYYWHLRRLMAERGLFATTELRPLLAQRGVRLSREQVYRLVTGTPQRLSLVVLAALCDILECSPAELVERSTSCLLTRSLTPSGSWNATRKLAIGCADA